MGDNKYMKNSKHMDKIVLAILLGAVIVFVAFVKNPNIKAGGSCLFLGLAVLYISWCVYKMANQELFNFEVESKEILVDIASNGVASEYYGIYNIEVVNKLRNKLIKRNRKQLIGCIALGIIFIVVAIICFV